MPAQPHSSDIVVKNAARLVEAFRKNHMPVFLVHVTPSADARDGLRPLTDGKSPIGSPRPADWAELAPELQALPADFVITKRQWGAFYGTELDLQLRRRKMETIILCGISTNMGVESTARFAFEYGYQQIFVEDACAARSKEEHEHSMKYIFPRIGRVRSAEQVLTELNNA